VWWYFNRFQAFNWRQTSSLWTPERKSLHCKTLRNWNPLLITQLTLAFSSSTALFCSRQNPLSFQLWESEWTSCFRIQLKCVDKSHLITCYSLAPQTSRIRDIGTKSDLSRDLFKSKLIELASRLWWFSMDLYRCFWRWRSSCCSCHVRPKTSRQASTKHLVSLLSGSSWHCTCAEHHIVRCSWWVPHTIETSTIYTCSNLSELLKNITSRTTVNFIEEIGLNRKVWILKGVLTTP